MTRACFSIVRLLERRVAGLSEAERLVLEQHLTTCSSCREQSALLSGLRTLSDRASESVSVPRGRLIARAIQRAEQGERPQSYATPARRRIVRAAVGVALAAALVMVTLGARRGLQRGTEPAASQPLERSRLVTGAVGLSDRRLAPGDSIPENQTLSLDRSSELALGHARVRASEASGGQWIASQMSFSLDRGALAVSVDPRPKRPFSVRTSRFVVEVLGTEFQVDLVGVRVARGLVRVVSPAGLELARVAAGQTWQVTEPTAALPPASAPPASAPPASAPAVELTAPRSAGDQLALARRALSGRDLSTARHALGSALAAHPSAQEQAEAHMLLGDWARLSGDFVAASREYLGVRAQFPALALAESALFSAARAEASAGRGARSQELLAQYLSQYPHGQFRQEAAARLAAPGSRGQN